MARQAAARFGPALERLWEEQEWQITRTAPSITDGELLELVNAWCLRRPVGVWKDLRCGAGGSRCNRLDLPGAARGKSRGSWPTLEKRDVAVPVATVMARTSMG
jgi:hypothetical protein